jgi:hypothetical protein
LHFYNISLQNFRQEAFVTNHIVYPETNSILELCKPNNKSSEA